MASYYNASGKKVLTAQVAYKGGINIETLAAGVTMDAQSSNLQILNPNGSNRTIVLPAEETNDGLWFSFRNSGSSGNLVITDDASSTILTLNPGESGTVGCDGSAWAKAFEGTPALADFGSTGMKTDIVAESTSGSGVTVDGLLIKDGDVVLVDSDSVKYGTGLDIVSTWDGTIWSHLPAADDSVTKWGNGTLNLDQWWYGNIATAYMEWDASASLIGLRGPVRPVGFNSLSNRYELQWVPTKRPALNGVLVLDENSNAATHTAAIIADRDFELLGTNMTTALCTFNAEGGITLTTAGADGDEAILLPHLDTNQTAWSVVTWGTDQQTEWECDIKSGANITNAIIWAGLKLTNTEVLSTDAKAAWFRYEDDVTAGKWIAVTSINNVDVSTDTGVTVATSTRYHLKIAIDSSRIARFWINGVLVHTSTALDDASDLIPYIGVAADGGAGAKAINVYGQAISRVAA